jgi:hypothetical protein
LTRQVVEKPIHRPNSKKMNNSIGPGCLQSARLCCKSRKLQAHEFFAKARNGKRSPIRIDAIALSKSPVSLTLGDEGPSCLITSPMLPNMKKNEDGSHPLHPERQAPALTRNRTSSPAERPHLPRHAPPLAEDGTAIRPASRPRHLESTGHITV